MRRGMMLIMLTTTAAAHATAMHPAEHYELQRWVAAKLLGQLPPLPESCLRVEANNDVVQAHGRLGAPLRLGRRQFRQGLFTHAQSRILVRLPEPGTRFEALVGVDSNEQTSGGRGSVVFVVAIGDREVFRSPLLREGMEPVAVSVPLQGAREFTLRVEAAGDGIACDQADWAEARVATASGSLWLATLPIVDARRPPPDPTPPFSFVYDGKPAGELLSQWRLQRESTPLDGARTQHTLTYTDPATGLQVRCLAIEYHDFPVVEWTVYLKNTGPADTPVIEDLQALDWTLQRWGFPPAAGCEWQLHHFTGTPYSPEDYAPHLTELAPNTTKRITAAGGRPTNSDLCYFNLQQPSSEGVILGLGWPGQWAASFRRDEATGLRVTAGQELTHLRLHPEEQIRTPLVALLFWRGDWIRGQNLWRRWMMAHNLPRPGGKLPGPQLAACSSHQFGEMINANDENQKLFLDRYAAEGIKLDYWWMDAGWYPNERGWPQTGTWEVDRQRFPGGLRSISDHARRQGVKTLVWFEPERVTADTWLWDERPQWLLDIGTDTRLLDLGNPEARQWLTEHVDGLLNSQGIDLYRQDFNMDPLPYWRAHDPEDRQGITEIRHVEGYLAYWDELRRRHPDMLIDSCASGGRRNDLETLRRAVPLLRSDWLLEPVSQQGHTYGVAFWYPFWGTGVNSSDPYDFRSVMCPHMTACYDVRRQDLDYDSIRRLIAQWREVAPYLLLGDYYPLTGYSLRPEDWMAWQFDRPEEGAGVVQVFRRGESIYEVGRLRLRGLDPGATYVIRDLDGGETEASGRQLLDDGLRVEVTAQPGAKVFLYRRVP